MSKAKPPAKKTRPTVRVKKHTEPPVSQERRKKQAEAETLPPPPPTPRQSVRAKKTPSAVTVDEVTADLSKDPRREE
jgi:hypothetical protein